MTASHLERALDTDLDQEKTAFLVTGAMLVFAVGYQLGKYLASGEFDLLPIVVTFTATVAVFAALTADDEEDA